MITDDKTGDISRLNLRLHGIHYEPEVYRVHDASQQALLDHIDAVREGVLSFESTIPQEWK